MNNNNQIRVVSAAPGRLSEIKMIGAGLDDMRAEIGAEYIESVYPYGATSVYDRTSTISIESVYFFFSENQDATAALTVFTRNNQHWISMVGRPDYSPFVSISGTIVAAAMNTEGDWVSLSSLQAEEISDFFESLPHPLLQRGRR